MREGVDQGLDLEEAVEQKCGGNRKEAKSEGGGEGKGLEEAKKLVR